MEMAREYAPRGYLTRAEDVGEPLLARARTERKNALVLELGAGTERGAFAAAAGAARRAGLDVYAWIEVGRDPAAAAEHPEWLTTPWHPEWLTAFPHWQASEEMMPAVAPWVSVHNRAVFDYALGKIDALLGGLPAREALSGVLLNDVQSCPTGCGCGNPLCRSWDVSPGTKVAPSPFTHTEDYFTVRFVDAVAAAHPDLTIIPVICSECEIGVTLGGIANPDLATGHCHGVTCGNPCGAVYYPGLVRALRPRPCVGLLSLYREFQRDLPLYGSEAAWCAAILDGYRQHNASGTVVSVLQGWDVTPAQVEAQVAQADRGGADGHIVALMPIEQSWWPVAVPRRELHLEGHICGAAPS